MSAIITNERARLFLDIETIPDQRLGAKEAARDRVQAPSNYKKPEAIQGYVDSKAEEAWLRTSLSGLYGQIAVVGWAVDNDEVSTIYGLDERKLLDELWRQLGKRIGNNPIFVGHAIADFDLPFIYQRSLINNSLPTIDIAATWSPYASDIFDTGYQFTGQAKGGIKLGDLAELLGFPSPKDGMDGSMVWPMIEAGRIAEVAEYCAKDVETVRAIYRKMRHFTEAGRVQDETPF